MATLLLLLSFVFAGEKSPFEQALEQNVNFQTNERWVQYGATRYREVEFKGDKYYIKFTGRAGEFAELDCDVPLNPHNPRLIEAGAEVFRRTKVFIEFLQETCEKKNGQRRTNVKFDAPLLGFTIPDDKNSTLKNKKVGINPLDPTALQFRGDW